MTKAFLTLLLFGVIGLVGCSGGGEDSASSLEVKTPNATAADGSKADASRAAINPDAAKIRGGAEAGAGKE